MSEAGTPEVAREPGVGIEPTTCSLQVSCATAAPTRPGALQPRRRPDWTRTHLASSPGRATAPVLRRGRAGAVEVGAVCALARAREGPCCPCTCTRCPALARGRHPIDLLRQVVGVELQADRPGDGLARQDEVGVGTDRRAVAGVEPRDQRRDVAGGRGSRGGPQRALGQGPERVALDDAVGDRLGGNVAGICVTGAAVAGTDLVALGRGTEGPTGTAIGEEAAGVALVIEGPITDEPVGYRLAMLEVLEAPPCSPAQATAPRARVSTPAPSRAAIRRLARAERPPLAGLPCPGRGGGAGPRVLSALGDLPSLGTEQPPSQVALVLGGTGAECPGARGVVNPTAPPA